MIPAHHGGHDDGQGTGRRQLVLDDRSLDDDPYGLDEDEGLDGGLAAAVADVLAEALDRVCGALRWWPGVAALAFLVGWGWAVRYPTPLAGPLVGLAATVGLCWSAARTEWTWRGFTPGELRPSWVYRLALPVTAAAGLMLAYWPAALQRLSAFEEVRRCR